MIKEWQGCLVYLEVREVPEMMEYRDSPVIEDLRYSCVNTKLRKTITAANSKDQGYSNFIFCCQGDPGRPGSDGRPGLDGLNGQKGETHDILLTLFNICTYTGIIIAHVYCLISRNGCEKNIGVLSYLAVNVVIMLVHSPLSIATLSVIIPIVCRLSQ